MKSGLIVVLVTLVALSAAQTRPSCSATEAATHKSADGCYPCLQAGCNWCDKVEGVSFCSFDGSTAASVNCTGTGVDGGLDKFIVGDMSAASRESCAKCNTQDGCGVCQKSHCGFCANTGVCGAYDSNANSTRVPTKIWQCTNADFFLTTTCDTPCGLYNNRDSCLEAGRCWFCPSAQGAQTGRCTTAGDTTECTNNYLKPIVDTNPSSASIFSVSTFLVGFLSLFL